MPASIAFSIAFDVIEIPELVGGLGVITDDVCSDRLLLACDCTPLDVTRKNGSERVTLDKVETTLTVEFVLSFVCGV